MTGSGTGEQCHARQIERPDAEIDALVYELYGLTEEIDEVIEVQGGWPIE